MWAIAAVRDRIRTCRHAASPTFYPRSQSPSASLASSVWPRARGRTPREPHPTSSSSTARSTRAGAPGSPRPWPCAATRSCGWARTRRSGPLAGQTTTVIDARGGAVVPGLNDSHLHVISGGLSLQQAALGEARSLDELQKVIREFAAAHPDRPWVLGSGWTYTAVPGGLPDEAATRRGGARPAGGDGGLRRSHELGQLAGAEAGGHHGGHARPGWRRRS